MYNTNSQIKFETAMLKSSLSGYSGVYILFNGVLSVANAVANNDNKKVVLKNHAQFTDFINEINNSQVDNAKEIDIVMFRRNLMAIFLNNAHVITDFTGNNASDFFNLFFRKITRKTGGKSTRS